jgi:hypothetical protein
MKKIQVFLMVDNYDVPFVHIRRHWEVLKMRTQGIEFLRQIFTLVLDAQNPGLKRALLAGRFYIQDGSTRGRRSEIGDHKFAPYFGVYEHEFNDLLTYNDESRNADRIREQYCGFLTDRDRNGDRRACNPASLFNYLQLKMLHCFVNGEEISLVKSLLENGLLRKNLETLIAEVDFFISS